MKQIFDIAKLHWLDLAAYIITIITYSLLIIFSDIYHGDWQSFVKPAQDGVNVISYGIDRYFSWSSRFLIEISNVIFSDKIWLWTILTVLLGVLLLYSVKKIFKLDGKMSCIFAILISLTNIGMYDSAGIFATVINYLWPVSLGMFAISVLVDFCRKNFKINDRYGYAKIVLGILALSFAIWQEQVSVVLALVFLGVGIYYWQKTRKVSWVNIVYGAIASAGVINALVCPGNAIRKAEEIGRWFPEFSDISIFTKAIISFENTMWQLAIKPEIIFIIFIIVLLVLAIKKRNQIATLFSSLVLLFSIPSLLPEVFGSTIIGSINRLLDSSMNHQDIPNMYNMEDLTTLLILVLIVVMMIGAIVTLLKDRQKSITLIFILFVGFISKSMVALSPTVFSSANRTLYIFELTIILATIYILQNFYRNKELKK